MLQLDPGMMIWTWVTFIGLFLILAKVAWKPLLSAVEQRERTIGDSLKRAEEAKAKAEAYLQEQEEKLANAQEEIQKMLKENKDFAEKMKADIVEKAREEAEKLRQKAHGDIEREKQAAMLELRKEVADLAIQAASALMRENLDAPRHKALIDDYLKELDSANKN